MASFVVALVIFVATFVLISIRTLVGIKLDRPAVALLGAALMIALGVLTSDQVFEVFGPQGSLTQVLLLLLGTMLLVGALELAGFFEVVSGFMVARATTPTRFITLLMATVGLLSALVLNDTIVLLFTPVVVRSCKALALNPVPYLVAEAVAANVGSLATEVGNPQIALIAVESGIPFLQYTILMAPLTVICMLAAVAILRWTYRGRLGNLVRPPPAHPIDPGLRIPLLFLVALTMGVVAVFFLSGPLGLNLSLVAFSGGALATFSIPLFRVGPAREVLQKVDWSILLFFVGLFILLEGVEVAGVMDPLVRAFAASSGGQLTGIGWVTAISALLSNLISNVPAVALLSRVLLSTPGAAVPTHTWLALAASSTLAGNATILGAAANVIVVQTASSRGVEVRPWDFMKGGMAVTLATLVLSAAYIQGLALLGWA